ncbi:MAG: DUF1566 domain-containing protein [Candidatus Electrothrix sp. AW5]|nr:DUF1566 domain-containing protein [Candidatus Electrothrix gigas]
MKKERYAVIIILIGLLWCDFGICASYKVALVIGNGDYENRRLKNPVNDANDLSQELGRLGFDVMKRTNVTHQELDEALIKFKQKIKPGGVALFYFAGHGMQVNGINYLIPIGDPPHAEYQIKHKSVSANMVQEAMESTKSKLNIIILDACRDNPFEKFRSSSRKGLAMMNTVKGMLIMYATDAGSVASDNQQGRNGLFTEKLLETLKIPGLSIEKVFKEIGKKVTNASGGKQEPWLSSKFYDDFYFIPPKTTNRPPDPDPEKSINLGIDKETKTEKTRIGKYIDNGDGTITDTETGLMWKRCAEGLSGKNCEKGKAKEYTWNDAVKRFKNVSYANYTDWRLPTIDELKTLVYCSKGVKNKKNGECNKGSEIPTINQQAFPNTKYDRWSCYWSGSPGASNSDFAWYVDFFNGSSINYDRNIDFFAVRLVRSGQPNKDHSAEEEIKIGKYINNGNGTITDTKTGLMWKRCPEGLSGKNCEKGKAKEYSWNDAVKRFKNVSYAGYDDWRMPTIDELKTLVYCSKGVKNKKNGECNKGSTKPTINQKAFPNTTSWPPYWSSSPNANYSAIALYVHFSNGNSYNVNRNNSYAVRLVRSGQSPKNSPQGNPNPGTAGKKIGKYIDNRDGTITDTETGLMWKRCPEGLSGEKCEKGKMEELKWNDAVRRSKNIKYAGHSDWRIPTLKELKTLVYCSKGVKNKSSGRCNDGSEEPTINQQAFPNAEKALYVWSESLYDPYTVRLLKFVNGVPIIGAKGNLGNATRLVRKTNIDSTKGAR